MSDSFLICWTVIKWTNSGFLLNKRGYEEHHFESWFVKFLLAFKNVNQVKIVSLNFLTEGRPMSLKTMVETREEKKRDSMQDNMVAVTGKGHQTVLTCENVACQWKLKTLYVSMTKDCNRMGFGELLWPHWVDQADQALTLLLAGERPPWYIVFRTEMVMTSKWKHVTEDWLFRIFSLSYTLISGPPLSLVKFPNFNICHAQGWHFM